MEAGEEVGGPKGTNLISRSVSLHPADKLLLQGPLCTGKTTLKQLALKERSRRVIKGVDFVRWFPQYLDRVE